ncbi:Putative protein of unknown function [Podospora comata]|uniref:Uncharacterized protein n=1 Tax=Podospora comata TaxID=48703 RepID=A0ABY6SA74_PODCO|nr:Putative protein of unknown function [Podospora comata]
MPRRQRARHARENWDARRQPKKRKSVANKPAPISWATSDAVKSGFRGGPSSPRKHTSTTSDGGNTLEPSSGYSLRRRTRGKDLRLLGTSAEKQQDEGHLCTSQDGVNSDGGTMNSWMHENASNITTLQDRIIEENIEAETTPKTRIDAATVQENRRRLRESEEMARRKSIAKYQLTNDPEVFRPFLAPFIASGEHKRELGEWQWDAEVERYWRMSKTTGTKVWEPLWESFI